jgi:hypothetical protein
MEEFGWNLFNAKFWWIIGIKVLKPQQIQKVAQVFPKNNCLNNDYCQCLLLRDWEELLDEIWSKSGRFKKWDREWLHSKIWATPLTHQRRW